MSLSERICARAREEGFDQVRFAAPDVLARWEADRAERPHERWQRLHSDPRAVLPGVKTAILLLKGYRPFRMDASRVALSPYYVASNRAFRKAKELAAWLGEQGVQAVASPPLPLKAFAVQCGAARYGRNGISASDALGSFQVIELILTDAALPVDDGGLIEGDAAFSAACQTCHACVKACPTGALKGDGLVDMDRCLRALDAEVVLPEWARAAMGNRLLGCDACQTVCPRNAAIEPIDAPEAVRMATDLNALLVGETAPLAALIGDNYARMKRSQARGCVMAANLGRRDLTPLIERLSDDDFPPLREQARWALAQLNESNKRV